MIKSYDKELLTEDLQSGEKIYLFFRSNGCSPCKKIESAIEKVANDFDDIFYIIESNEAKDLQQRVGVVAYPTLSIVQEEKVIYNALGEHKIMELL